MLCIIAFVATDWGNVCLYFRVFVQLINLLWLNASTIWSQWMTWTVGFVALCRLVWFCRFSTAAVSLRLAMHDVLWNVTMKVLVGGGSWRLQQPWVFTWLSCGDAFVWVRHQSLVNEILGKRSDILPVLGIQWKWSYFCLSHNPITCLLVFHFFQTTFLWMVLAFPPFIYYFLGCHIW